jgi:hypothetical protein
MDQDFTTRQRIIGLVKADVDKELTASDIARQLGVSPQRVGQILKEENLRVPRYATAYRPAERRPPAPRIITAVPFGHVTNAATGTVSELIAAADLLARGWNVFFPMTRTSKHDLIITDRDGERVLRIEVKSGYRKASGALQFQKQSKANCDHYAIVVTGEPVNYQPELPILRWKGELSGPVLRDR